MEKIFDACDWAVYYIIPAATQDDKKDGATICAWFHYRYQAEEFIEKVLPAGNGYRFHIAHRDDLHAGKKID